MYDNMCAKKKTINNNQFQSEIAQILQRNSK